MTRDAVPHDLRPEAQAAIAAGLLAKGAINVVPLRHKEPPRRGMAVTQRIWRRCWILVCVLVLAGPEVAIASIPEDPDQQQWVARFSAPGHWDSDDMAESIAIAPDGSKLFVTGSSHGGSGDGIHTVAYSTTTGAPLWVARYRGSGSHERGNSLAVAPDGSKVFVTGLSYNSNIAHDHDFVTVAYSTANGAQLWVARYNGPGNSDDNALSLAVAPDGSKVFVAGLSKGLGNYYDYFDYATVAYSTATGAQLWVARYNGPGNYSDYASSLAVAPDGSKVFVTGASIGSGGAYEYDFDYATVAYSTATGAQLWIARYNGPGKKYDSAHSMAIAPDGSTVFVTGSSVGSGDPYDYYDFDYATVAYSAATGVQLWIARYNGPGKDYDSARSLAIAPDGSKVFVTGSSYGYNHDYATIAYSTATGDQLWVARYNGPAFGNAYDLASSLAVAPDGSNVFVTGLSARLGSSTENGTDYATVAYSTATGARLWVARYNGPGNYSDYASSLAVAPNGSRVFVTGSSTGLSDTYDYATVAYSNAPSCDNGKDEAGPASGVGHDHVEPLVGPTAAPYVHGVNCDVVAANGL